MFQLLDHYLDDTYYPADVSFDGQSLTNVGIRSRGDGSRSNVKPAIQVSFAKYQKGQTLFGLQGFALKNLVQDASMLREALALPVFAAMGIPSPRASFARLFVNGQYYGLYNVIEDVDDDPFLLDHFNFYVYQHTGATRFVVVPWDKNTSFTAGSWPLFRGIDHDVVTSRLFADPAQRQAYVAAAKQAVTSYVNSDWLGPRVDAFYAQLHDAALADPKKPFTNEQFELALGGLRGVIAARRADVLAQAP